MIHFVANRETTFGPNVHFNCPKCGAKDATGASFEWLETFCLFHLIPLFKLRNAYVTCSRCQEQLSSDLSLEEIRTHVDADLTPFVACSSSFVIKFLAITSLLLCWMPIIGLVLALAVLAATFRTPGWVRTVALVSAVPSLLITAVAIVGIASSP